MQRTNTTTQQSKPAETLYLRLLPKLEALNDLLHHSPSTANIDAQVDKVFEDFEQWFQDASRELRAFVKEMVPRSPGANASQEEREFYLLKMKFFQNAIYPYLEERIFALNNINRTTFTQIIDFYKNLWNDYLSHQSTEGAPIQREKIKLKKHVWWWPFPYNGGNLADHIRNQSEILRRNLARQYDNYEQEIRKLENFLNQQSYMLDVEKGQNSNEHLNRVSPDAVLQESHTPERMTEQSLPQTNRDTIQEENNIAQEGTAQFTLHFI